MIINQFVIDKIENQVREQFLNFIEDVASAPIVETNFVGHNTIINPKQMVKKQTPAFNPNEKPNQINANFLKLKKDQAPPEKTESKNEQLINILKANA